MLPKRPKNNFKKFSQEDIFALPYFLENVQEFNFAVFLLIICNCISEGWLCMVLFLHFHVHLWNLWKLCSNTVTFVSTIFCYFSENLNNSSFKAYLTGCLKDKLILPGNTLHVNYFGKPCQLQVWSITGIDDQEFLCSQSEEVSQSGDQNLHQSGCKTRTTNLSMRTNETSDNSSKDRSTLQIKDDSLSDTTDMPDQNECMSGTKSKEDFPSSPNVTTSTPKRTTLPSKPTEKMANNLDDLSTSLKGLAISSPNKQFITDHPQMVFKLTSVTDIVLVSESKLNGDGAADKGGINHASHVTYDMIGGLKRQLKTIRDTLEVPLINPEIFNTLGRFLIVFIPLA